MPIDRDCVLIWFSHDALQIVEEGLGTGQMTYIGAPAFARRNFAEQKELVGFLHEVLRLVVNCQAHGSWRVAKLLKTAVVS